MESIVSDEDANPVTPVERTQQVLAAIPSLHASWRSTDLGLALTTVADRLVRTEQAGEMNGERASEIVLISDLQAGSRIDQLENYQWPSGCVLRVERIAPSKTANVSASLLRAKEEGLISQTPSTSKTAEPADESSPSQQPSNSKTSSTESVAVRLAYVGDSAPAKVTLHWSDANGEALEGTRLQTELASHEASVVRMVALNSDAGRLVLEGDHVTFDNERFVARPPVRAFSLVCIDKASASRPTALDTSSSNCLLGIVGETFSFNGELRIQQLLGLTKNIRLSSSQATT